MSLVIVAAMPIEAQFDALLRLVLAGVAGSVLGFERETQDKPAGIRTFAVVAMGSCLFTLVGELAFDGKDDAVSRLVAQKQLAAGTPLVYVSQLVGHKRITTTEKYLKLLEQPDMQAQVHVEEL